MSSMERRRPSESGKSSNRHTENTAFAERVVAQMPEELRRAFQAWAKLQVAWHTGSDAWGQRISGEARQTLGRSLQALENQITEQHGNGRSFGALSYQNGLDHPEVRTRLAKEEDK